MHFSFNTNHGTKNVKMWNFDVNNCRKQEIVNVYLLHFHVKSIVDRISDFHEKDGWECRLL